MQLFVVGVRQKNSSRKTFTLNHFSEDDSIRTLKMVISNKFCVPIKLFYLVSESKTLNEDGTLKKFGITNESTIHVMFRAGQCLRSININ
jgi:hypothetical protein